jgi:hypothetical protein
VRQVGYTLALLIGAAALHFALVFPAPHPALWWLLRRGPAWLRGAGGLGLLLAIYLLPLGLTLPPLLGPRPVLVVALVGVAWIVLVRTYRRLPSPVARAQLTWIVYGGLVWLAGAVLNAAFVQLGGRSQAMPWFILAPTGALLPVALGVAVLRYRLFDIDVVVNRTVVYAALTACLGLVYWGGVLLQPLLRLLTQGGELAVAGATLVAAALFRPLRGLLQAGIDRRFYRRKYDAAREVAALGTRLQREADPKAVRAAVLAAAQAALQPGGAALWLRAPAASEAHVGSTGRPGHGRSDWGREGMGGYAHEPGSVGGRRVRWVP